MAAETKASVAARFANGAFVSAGDFSTLVDSYTDRSDVLLAIATAAQNGSKGVVVVSGSSNVTLFSAQAAGLRLLNTATTAAAQSQLGGGTAGAVIFSAVTTASAVGHLGGGTVGAQILAVTTTSQAQAIIGSVSAATQAEMEAAVATGVVVTPANMANHPGMPKAWVNFNGITTASVRSSFNVASVSRNGTGDYSVVFSVPFSNAGYCYVGQADQSAASNNAPRTINQVETTAGGIRFICTDNGPTANDCEVVNVVFFGDR